MSPKRVVPILLVVVLIGVGVWYAFFRHTAPPNELMASGTVEATDAPLGFQLPGRVLTVRVHEGDLVKAGDTLATLDRTELDARRAQAVAQRDAAKALLTELERGSRTEELSQARDASTAAEQKFADAQRDYERTKRLQQGGAVSQEVLDKSTLALQVAQSQRDQARAQLELVQAGPRPERITGQRAMVEQAEAAVRQADAAITNAVIRAPFDGVVTVRDREPGETVAAGAPVVTITNLGDRWVRIYIPEDHVGAVRLGQNASISSDTYPDKRYAGTVSFISSVAEFTPRNVQTTEERVKLVYAVKVRVSGDPSNDLKPGMPADVRLGLVVGH